MRWFPFVVAVLPAGCAGALAPLPEAPAPVESFVAPAEPGRGPWWTYAEPCEEGTRLRGAPPPAGAEAWCETADGVRHGMVTWWDEVGFKMAEGQYLDGVPEGEWLTWHENGALKLRASYRAGKPHGTWLGYHDNGRVSTEVRYDHGVQHGPWSWWYDTGRQAATGNFHAGKPHGRWVRWDPHGRLVKLERYDEDELLSSYVAPRQ